MLLNILNFLNNNIIMITLIVYSINLINNDSTFMITFLVSYLLISIISFLTLRVNINLLKKISLFLTIYTFLIFVYIYNFLNNFSLIYYFFYKLNNILIQNFSIEYSIGVDTISYLFLLLTAFLFPLCLMISWNTIYYQTYIII